MEVTFEVTLVYDDEPPEDMSIPTENDISEAVAKHVPGGSSPDRIDVERR